MNYLHYTDFTLYVGLKVNSFDNIYNNYPEKLCEFMQYANTRPLYEHLNILKEERLIKHDYDTYPNYSKLEIEVKEKNPFTGLKFSTIEAIVQIIDNANKNKSKNKLKHMAIRLYYYYKLQYNKALGYAYPSIKTINLHTGISRKDIVILNKIFEKNKILYIEHGKHKDKDSKTKENNLYVPILEFDNFTIPTRMCNDT